MSTLSPAHAFGARYDLPIALLLLVVAGVAVAIVSFLLMRPRGVRADDANADVPYRVPEAALNVAMTTCRNRSNHSWTKHRTRLMWAFSALLVAVGWLLTPHPVPVYDGIGMPDEPYRYVSTPPGALVTAKPAGSVQGTLSVVGGVNPQLGSLRSNEFGPQVSVYLPVGVLAAPGGTITVNVVPEAPSHPPADGPIDGNVYRVSFTDPAGPVTLNSSKSMIYLRATTAKQPGPVIEQRLGPGQKWRLLDTTRTGNDIYGAALPEAGDYALVYSKLAHARDATPGVAAGGNHELIIGLFVLFFLLFCVVFAVRSRVQEVDP